MSEVLKNVHGHTIVELTNVHTGEKKIVEDDNTVTNYVDHLLNSAWPTTHPLGWRARGFFPWFYGSQKDMIMDLTQGLMIFDKRIPEDNNFNYIIPGNVRYIGGGTNATYSGDCLEYGSWNENEFVDNSSVDGDRYVQYVWDFATNQANGKINSVCLTTRAGGRVGAGSRLWNGNFYQGAGSGSNYGSYFQIGRYTRLSTMGRNERVYVPHPFNTESLNVGWPHTGNMTLFYPWYDIDNDILLISNQTCTENGSQSRSGISCYYKTKGNDSYEVSGKDYVEYLNNSRIFDSSYTSWTGIDKPLTLWKYHTKPKQWDIYSSYYKQWNDNSAFDHMFIEKKEFMLPDEIRQELQNSYITTRQQMIDARVPRYKRRYASCYYTNRLFATENYLYQIFKPWRISETDNDVWLPNEYVYVWKIKTDLSGSEVIKVENTTDAKFCLYHLYCKDMTRIFVCDDYLFTRDLDSVLWMYSFIDESWVKIKNKDGGDFKDVVNGDTRFPQRTYFFDKNKTLYIRAAGYYRGEDWTDYGNGGATLVIRPLIREGSILNIRGDHLDQTEYEDFNYDNSYDSWNTRGIYTYVKSNNPKMIFNMMRIGNYGEYAGNSDIYANQPNIASYNYINPVITTINNLPEEVEKTEDYTMKITYRVSWSDPD